MRIGSLYVFMSDFFVFRKFSHFNGKCVNNVRKDTCVLAVDTSKLKYEMIAQLTD